MVQVEDALRELEGDDGGEKHSHDEEHDAQDGHDALRALAVDGAGSGRLGEVLHVEPVLGGELHNALVGPEQPEGLAGEGPEAGPGRLHDVHAVVLQGQKQSRDAGRIACVAAAQDEDIGVPGGHGLKQRLHRRLRHPPGRRQDLGPRHACDRRDLGIFLPDTDDDVGYVPSRLE